MKSPWTGRAVLVLFPGPSRVHVPIRSGRSAGLVRSGESQLVLCADDEGLIAESSELDNCFGEAVRGRRAGRPDLRVEPTSLHFEREVIVTVGPPLSPRPRSMAVPAGIRAPEKDFRIRLKSRTFDPAESPAMRTFSAIPARRGRRHVLVQFEDIPTARSDGIWRARASGCCPISRIGRGSRPSRRADLRAVAAAWHQSRCPARRRRQALAGIRTRGVGAWARDKDGSARVMVTFYEDVRPMTARL